MPVRRPWPTLVLLVLANLGLAHYAAAQQTTTPKQRPVPPPRPYICLPNDPTCNPGTHTPTITISPGNETVGNPQLPITITICDAVSIASYDVTLTPGLLGTGDITSKLTATRTTGTGGCTATVTLTGTVTLGPPSDNIISVSAVNDGISGNTVTATNSATYTYANYAFSFSGPQPVTPTLGENTAAEFVLTGLGNISNTFTVATTCTGAAVINCKPPTSVTLGPAPSVAIVSVPYTASSTPGTSGTITVTLTSPNTKSVTQTAVITMPAPVWQLSEGAAYASVDPGLAVTTTASFGVTNTGNEPNSVTYTAVCTGAAIISCSKANPSSASLAPGGTSTVVVTYTTTDTGGTSGTVVVNATGSNNSSATASTLVVMPAADPGTLYVNAAQNSVNANPGTTNTVSFIIASSGNVPNAVTYTATCSGFAIVTCGTATPSSGSVPPSGSGTSTVTVTYTTNATPSQNNLTGAITLAATGQFGTNGSATTTINEPAPFYGLTVTPSQPTETVPTSQANAVSFTVKNTGNDPTPLTFAAACTGNAIATNGCGTPSPASATLQGGQSQTVTVSVTTGSLAPATGSVSLNATNPNIDASGTTTLTILAPVPGTLDVVSANPGMSFNRANCLIVDMAPHAAWECGDLRITHPFPSVRTYNTVKTPTLIYNWRFATPAPNLAAFLTTPPTNNGVALDSVTATLHVWPHNQPSLSQVAMTGTWHGSDWGTTGTTPITRRIQLTWGGYSSSSGAYDFAFATVRHYGTTTAQDSSVGHFIFVNRFASPYGAGWWISGLEQLFPYSDGIAWIGGDGSTQWYTRPGNTGTVWYPQTYVAEHDSITQDAQGYLYRHAAHGTTVEYFSNGLHWKTTNRLGHTTGIAYDNHSRVERIDIAAAVWTHYNLVFQSDPGVNDTTLVSVTSPDGRVVQFLNDSLRAGGATRSHTTIQDPDGLNTTFTYDPSGGGQTRINSRLDKRGTLTIFGFGLGAEGFGYVHTNMNGTGIDIQQTVGTSNNMGQAAPWMSEASTHAADPDSFYVQFVGPRANAGNDSLDITTFWLDRWWQPIHIRDAKGSDTYIARSNPTYPNRVTQTQDPLGRVETAVYDNRGNDSVITDLGTFVGGQYAVTHYTVDPHWDFVSKVIEPAGDSTMFVFDPSTGNTTSQLAGDYTGRTVNFSYYPSTSPWSGMLESIVQPMEAPQAYTFTYDHNQVNDSTATTPLGITTVTLRDPAGRPTATHVPIDVGDTTVTSFQYDAMDRVKVQTTAGPALTHNFDNFTSLLNNFPPANQPFTAAALTLTATTTFDPEGAPKTIQRTSTPDAASVGTQQTDFVLDAAGRAIKQIQHFGSPDSTAFDSTQYDAAGNAIVVVTRRSDTIRTVYDALNRRVHRFTAAKEYTQDNNISVTAYGGTHIFTVPAYPNCSDGTGYCIPADEATYVYDPLNRILQANNGDAEITRAYNLNGTLSADTLRIRTVSGNDFTQHVYGLSYTYDLESRRLTLTHPANIAPITGDGVVLGQEQYTYDGDGIGLLTDVTDVIGNDFTYEYDLDNRVMHLGSQSANEHWTYDADSHLHERVDSTTDQSTTDGWDVNILHDDIYAYDLRGKVIQIQDTASVEKLVILNAYDGLGGLVDGLIRPTSDVGSGVDNRSEEFYRLDAFGNAWWRWDNSWSYGAAADSGNTTLQSKYQIGSGRLLSSLQGANPLPQFITVTNAEYDSSGNQHRSIDSRIAVLAGLPGTMSHATGQLYDALQQLRVVDKQTCFFGGTSTCQVAPQTSSDVPYFSEYRYDALGRRIFARAHPTPTCAGHFSEGACKGFITRTVYDGNQILYEIRMPDSVGIDFPSLERDTGSVASYENTAWQYGRVAYTQGLTLDQPLDILRMGYDTLFPGPQQVVPLPDWRGGYDVGTLALGARYQCSQFPDSVAYYNNPALCFSAQFLDTQYGVFHQDLFFGQEQGYLPIWNGSLTADRRDPSNQIYLRNRYYDPQTGRFTQEDPIGLAGGLNAYGFAAGDPVNYSDPFGLCPPCSDAEYRFLGKDILRRTAGLDNIHFGGSIRIGPVRTTINVKPLSGAEIKTTLCYDCLTPASVEVHGGVDLREAGKGEPDRSIGIEDTPLTITNTGFEIGFGTPDWCIKGVCIETSPRQPAPAPPPTPLPNTIGHVPLPF